MHKSGRRARDICIVRAALVMLNFELGHEEDMYDGFARVFVCHSVDV